jgi:hypothetical protein
MTKASLNNDKTEAHKARQGKQAKNETRAMSGKASYNRIAHYM